MLISQGKGSQPNPWKPNHNCLTIVTNTILSTQIGATEGTKLTGADLLTLIKEHGDASKSDLVRAAGYVSIKKDGTERLNFTAFYEAVLEAKGMRLGTNPVYSGRPGRALSYHATVQFNGNLMVGRAYTAQLGLEPGDVYAIKLTKGNHIILSPVPPELAKEAEEVVA